MLKMIFDNLSFFAAGGSLLLSSILFITETIKLKNKKEEDNQPNGKLVIKAHAKKDTRKNEVDLVENSQNKLSDEELFNLLEKNLTEIKMCQTHKEFIKLNNNYIDNAQEMFERLSARNDSPNEEKSEQDTETNNIPPHN